MAKPRWYERLVGKSNRVDLRYDHTSFLRSIVTGSFYRVSDLKGTSVYSDIKSQIDVMRALARDPQISTAFDYYATDATIANSAGQVIWATAVDPGYDDVQVIVNALLTKWQVNKYARDHLLELATVGNLYIPTTDLYKEIKGTARMHVALDNNTLFDEEYDILPSHIVRPEEILHVWDSSTPSGFLYQPEEDDNIIAQCMQLPESAVIHFSLGGLLGKYSLEAVNREGENVSYDVQFAQPLLERAVQPTQTLSLLEDATVLSSLARNVKFINVECGRNEDETRDALQQIKDTIEQQFSLNTATGDAQSFMNPQSPNNFVYLPKINGNDAISVTDLNVAEATEADNNLLDYYLNKKLSVTGIPKEAFNFSGAEGLGNAGSVMSQRSQLYANILSRLTTAYMEGWRTAINTYFERKNMSGYVDKFELHMTPILTEMSTITFDRRDAALSQAQSIIQILKDLRVTNPDTYLSAVQELLTDSLPKTGSETAGWDIDVSEQENNGGGLDDF